MHSRCFALRIVLIEHDWACTMSPSQMHRLKINLDPGSQNEARTKRTLHGLESPETWDRLQRCGAACRPVSQLLRSRSCRLSNVRSGIPVTHGIPFMIEACCTYGCDRIVYLRCPSCMYLFSRAAFLEIQQIARSPGHLSQSATFTGMIPVFHPKIDLF